MDSEFPSNSQGPRAQRSAPEPKKVTRVVESDVVRRKKPLSKRAIEMFGVGSLREAWSTMVLDILVPAAKNTMADGVEEFFRNMIFGEDHVSRRRHGNSRGGQREGYIDYQRRYSSSGGRRDREEPRQQMSRRGRANHDFDDIILDSKAEAEEVIDQLFELVSKYEMATVSDLYNMLGIESSFTDEKWGWTDIRGAGISRVRNGWLLDLPRPEHIA